MAIEKAKSKPDDQLKAVRRRNIYVSGRLPEIKAELATLRSEKKDVAAKAKSSAGEELKRNAKRQIYLTARINVLSEEHKALKGEKEMLGEKLKAARGSGEVGNLR